MRYIYIIYYHAYSEVSNRSRRRLFIMRHFSHQSALIRARHLLNLENFSLHLSNLVNKKGIFALKDSYYGYGHDVY